MKLSFVPHTLKFKRPFSIAHGSRDSTPVVFTRLEHEGIFGYGEASMPPYLGENHETVLRFLSKAEKVLRKFSDPSDIETVLSEIDKIETRNTAAKASVDIALHDLVGKINLAMKCSGHTRKKIFSLLIPFRLMSRMEFKKE